MLNAQTMSEFAISRTTGTLRKSCTQLDADHPPPSAYCVFDSREVRIIR